MHLRDFEHITWLVGGKIRKNKAEILIPYPLF